MNWTAGNYLITGDANRRIFTKDNRGNASMKALLFGSLAFFSLFSLALMSVVSGGRADDAFSPKRNHVGFLWAFLTITMLFVLPWYLAKAYKPPLVIEMHRDDRSVRSNGSIITRFDRIEFFQLLTESDNDGRNLYCLVMIYGDGRELPIDKSYDRAGIRELSRELASFSDSTVRSSTDQLVT